jgi:hypothetical protein
MDTLETRRPRKTARSLALVVLAASMLPLNGCVGPLAQALPMLSSVLGPITQIMNLGQMIGSFGKSTGGSPVKLPSMPSFTGQTPFGVNSSTQNSSVTSQILSKNSYGDPVSGLDTQKDQTNG